MEGGQLIALGSAAYRETQKGGGEILKKLSQIRGGGTKERRLPPLYTYV